MQATEIRMLGTGVLENTPVIWLLTGDALLVVERGRPMSHARELLLRRISSASTERSGAGWAIVLESPEARPLTLGGLEASEAHHLLDAVSADSAAA